MKTTSTTWIGLEASSMNGGVMHQFTALRWDCSRMHHEYTGMGPSLSSSLTQTDRIPGSRILATTIFPSITAPTHPSADGVHLASSTLASRGCKGKTADQTGSNTWEQADRVWLPYGGLKGPLLPVALRRVFCWASGELIAVRQHGVGPSLEHVCVQNSYDLDLCPQNPRPRP